MLDMGLGKLDTGHWELGLWPLALTLEVLLKLNYWTLGAGQGTLDTGPW
jgi:hypothetical protein